MICSYLSEKVCSEALPPEDADASGKPAAMAVCDDDDLPPSVAARVSGNVKKHLAALLDDRKAAAKSRKDAKKVDKGKKAGPKKAVRKTPAVKKPAGWTKPKKWFK